MTKFDTIEEITSWFPQKKIKEGDMQVTIADPALEPCAKNAMCDFTFSLILVFTQNKALERKHLVKLLFV